MASVKILSHAIMHGGNVVRLKRVEGTHVDFITLLNMFGEKSDLIDPVHTICICIRVFILNHKRPGHEFEADFFLPEMIHDSALRFVLKSILRRCIVIGPPSTYDTEYKCY